MDEPWKERVPPRRLAHCAAHERRVSDGVLTVFVGKEDGSWHLSISHKSAVILDPVTQAHAFGRYPTWNEIRDARQRFLPDDLIFAMMLPGEKDYISGPRNSTVFHLWELPEKYAKGYRNG